MTRWVDIQWFGPADYGGSASSGTTAVVDTGTISQDSTGVSSGSSRSSDASGGSGSTPPIAVGTDYWLRNESGAVITDEYGDGLSLEGI